MFDSFGLKSQIHELTLGALPMLKQFYMIHNMDFVIVVFDFADWESSWLGGLCSERK